MKVLSTGDDSTLKNWRTLSVFAFGDTSAAVKYLDQKIAESGEDEEVIADEGQMILLLATINDHPEMIEEKAA